MVSLVRVMGRSKRTPCQPSITCGPLVPIPRTNRPSDIVWRASADIATAPLRTFEFPGTVSAVSGTGTVTFRPDGTVSSGTGNVRLQISLGSGYTARYDIAVSATGKVSATYTQVSS